VDFCVFGGYHFPFLEKFETTISRILHCKSISNMINLLIQPSPFLPPVTKAPICQKISLCVMSPTLDCEPGMSRGPWPWEVGLADPSHAMCGCSHVPRRNLICHCWMMDRGLMDCLISTGFFRWLCMHYNLGLAKFAVICIILDYSYL
jgi:hypothetical protein